MTTQSFPASTTALDQRLGNIGLGIGRIVVGLLWFSQVLWKLPPTFGCPANFQFSTREQYTTGLCDWIGREAVYAGNLHLFYLDLHLLGMPSFSIDLSSLSSAYGAFVRGFVMPNFGWMAWLIFGMEFFITITVLFGVFTRLGALVGIAQALNLIIGVLPVPGEWEWSDLLLLTFNFVILMTAAGRYIGIDAQLHRWAVVQATKGNKIARVVQWIT